MCDISTQGGSRRSRTAPAKPPDGVACPPQQPTGADEPEVRAHDGRPALLGRITRATTRRSRVPVSRRLAAPSGTLRLVRCGTQTVDPARGSRAIRYYATRSFESVGAGAATRCGRPLSIHPSAQDDTERDRQI